MRVVRDDGARRGLWWALLALTFSATALVGQEELTLEEAIRIAGRNNPQYLRQENDQGQADWGVRQAYGQLLPSATAFAQTSFRESGAEFVGTQILQAGTTDFHQAFYNLSFNWSLDGDAIYGVSSARANSRATQAGIVAAEFNLRNRVALQYMAVLRARDGVRVAGETLERSEKNFEIVRGRVDAGFAAGTEATQAEVEVGRAEVGLLQATQLVRTEKARLMQQLGVVMPDGFEPVDSFEVFEPMWSVDQLTSEAVRRHPSLQSFDASTRAAKASLRQAQSSYLPTVSLSTSLQGFGQRALNEDFVVQQTRDAMGRQFRGCQQTNALATGLPGGADIFEVENCSDFVYTDADGQAALDANTLSLQKIPVQLNLGVSIPIFQGFTRQRQIEQAGQAARDAELNFREEELRVRTLIVEAHEQLATAWRSVQIEERNRELSILQLDQARQRYQVGNTSILELRDAETSLQTAERDYLNAVYSFHQWLVALEAATGRELRPTPIGAAEDAELFEG